METKSLMQQAYDLLGYINNQLDHTTDSNLKASFDASTKGVPQDLKDQTWFLIQQAIEGL